MTLTETPNRDLFSDYEDATDEDVKDYAGLTDDHAVTNCRCGRLLLTGLPGGGGMSAAIEARGFKVTDADDLPPAAFGWVFPGAGVRRAVCCGCYVAERRANRGGR
jgi:hypothetical protein